MISTIICFYNEINYIKLTLESLRRQNFKNLEIILIDDCSQYGSQLIKICELFKDLKIIYYRNNSNIGLARSRNIGLDLSKGEYICFLDSDDEYLPKKLSSQYLVINKKKFDIVYSKELVEKNNSYFYRECNRKFELSILLQDQFINLNTLLISRKFLKDNNILFNNDELSRYGEDLEFLIKIKIHTNNIYFIDEFQTISRRRPDNHRNYKKIWNEFEKLDLMFNKFLEDKAFNLYHSIIKRKIINIKLKKSIAYILANKKDKFKTNFKMNFLTQNFKNKILLLILLISPRLIIYYLFIFFYLPIKNINTYKRFKINEISK